MAGDGTESEVIESLSLQVKRAEALLRCPSLPPEARRHLQEHELLARALQILGQGGRAE